MICFIEEMRMAALKRKEKRTQQKRESSVSPGSRRNEGSDELSIFWAEQIEKLGNYHFSSIEEVMEALILSVNERMGAGGSEAESAFLKQLLEMDPELRERLSRAFGVK